MWKLKLSHNKQQYSLPIKIMLLMMIGNIGPILLLTLYEFIRFHEILFGKGDILTVVYACSILLSLAFVGYIVCETTRPIKAFISSIEAYRQLKIKPSLHGITRVEEFNYLFGEYDKLINEIERYEIELVNKTTLAAIGATTAMVAHDVRKPLASIKMLLQALPIIKNKPEEIAQLTLEIEKSIINTNAMLNDILECSPTIKESDFCDHCIQRIISLSVHEVLRNKPEAKINIHYDFNHKNLAVYVDGLRLKRVFDNIITNSLEAMPYDKNNKIYGNLFFKTKLSFEDNKTYVKITIVDDGSGIPNELLTKIYEPFFSYGKNNGNGLGLTISRNIISILKGKIEIKNRIDTNGTKIILKLLAGKPVNNIDENFELINDSLQPNYANIIPQKDILSTPTSNGYYDNISILIADDEKIVRNTLRHMFASLFANTNSYKISEASTVEEALNLMTQNFFSHVITDIDFGKNCMNGYEFAKIIFDKYKDTYIIIHSNKRNETLDTELASHSSDKFLGFIHKPISSEELFKFILGEVQNN